ncbi:MAG TPA: carbohydrate binding domain-containing protein [Actinomycetes bacterium]|nr:carbohydrate binding domain-containing protein [Actinomycetes bacterium]
MQRTPPRHLAPPQRTRPKARDHLLVESILALVAIGLTTAIMIGTLLDRPESSAARLPNLLPPAPTTTRAAATVPSPASTRPPPAPDDGNLLADPGFETGLDGWRAVGGAGLERVAAGRGGDWGLRLTRGSSRWPGVLHGEVASLKADRRYEATAWVRASRPGVEVQVNLFELRGGKRFAVDTVGAVAAAGQWQRVDVSHDTHRPGATLALEILAPTLQRGTTLLVDDVTVRASSSPMKTH